MEISFSWSTINKKICYKREFHSFDDFMVGRADKGLIITTGTFTADARREATRDGAPAIDLVDGEALCILLKDLKLGVSVKLVEDVGVRAEFLWHDVVRDPVPQRFNVREYTLRDVTNRD